MHLVAVGLMPGTPNDVEIVLEHFAEDVVFTPPVAARVLQESARVVRGKDALRALLEIDTSLERS
ncbi:hypothetical protein LAUMK142_05795 [Mycobacterium pseudokansasii]|uniref:Uncharacterized protein n=1 Tax=Mycobacterium pseudokansasii TaxID=2341080 RepID=A0A498R3J7_9MYCO|nr:hypothetical protein LAUMK142_05795 [Mycobacterium pseudokansasii]